MLSRIESKINKLVSQAPFIKKSVKRLYQLSMYMVSPKLKFEGNIERVTPKDDYEYFFGYYDKSPWDVSERYMLCLRVKNTTKEFAPKENAEIILIDTHNDNEIEVIGTSRTWNIQQGCMLQWLGPNYKEKIIYNDFRDGRYCSVILNINTKQEKIIEKPIYSISEDGSFAITLDFSRLHRLRPGYGYSNLKERTKLEKCPDAACIWKIDLETTKITELYKYTDFYNFETREEMVGAEHKVNHLMLNPIGKRFMVLHRWIKGGKRYTRLVTASIEANELFNLSDEDMTSHCFWKSNNEIIAYAHKETEGNGYFLMKDNTDKYEHMWNELKTDGHPSYSPNGGKVVTDTYPNRSRVSSIYIIENNEPKIIARVFAPFKYDNEFRCDLHPRWNRKGDRICFDSVFEGKRGLYIIDTINKRGVDIEEN